LSYYPESFEAKEGKSVEAISNPLLRNNEQEKYTQHFHTSTPQQLEQITENIML